MEQHEAVILREKKAISNLRSFYADLNKSNVKASIGLKIFRAALLVVAISSLLFSFYINDVFVPDPKNLLSPLKGMFNIAVCIIVFLVTLSFYFMMHHGMVGMDHDWDESPFEDLLLEYIKQNLSQETLEKIYKEHVERNLKSFSIPSIEQAFSKIFDEQEKAQATTDQKNLLNNQYNKLFE